jgi:hypothetical protein
MSDSDTARRLRLLTPDTRHLNTAGKRYHPFHPSGVDQSWALWTRIFTFVLFVPFCGYIKVV